MDQRSIYNSAHKPQRSLDEKLGFNHGDHLHRMCNETGIPEFLEFQISGIPVVAITRHVRAPCAILPNKILSTRAPYPYISVTRVSSSEEPSSLHYVE